MQNAEEESLSNKTDDSSNIDKSMQNSEDSLNKEDSASGKDYSLTAEVNAKELSNDDKDIDNENSPKKMCKSL